MQEQLQILIKQQIEKLKEKGLDPVIPLPNNNTSKVDEPLIDLSDPVP